MPQISRYYANGRVSTLETTLLSPATLERLVSAGSVSEVGRALSDVGWGDAQDQPGIERLADEHVRRACALLKEVTPDQRLTDLFLIRYDILNMKVLIKARLLNEENPALSDNGTIDPERLRHAVMDANYVHLPELFRSVLKEIEDKIAVEQDPFQIDTRLDKLMFEFIRQTLADARNCPAPIRSYFTVRADAANILIALRTGAMGRDVDFAEDLFVRGGELSYRELALIVREPARLLSIVSHKPYFEAVRRGFQRYEQGEGLAPLEKQLEDYQLSLFKPHRHTLNSLIPLIGYLLAREREAAAVRLIVTAKAARISQDALSERMRRLYTD